MTEAALLEIGFSQGEAEMLSSDEDFHHRRKNAAELKAVFQKIANVYGCDIKEIMEAVLKFPQFASYDHERVVADAAAVYGDSEGVKKAVLKFPPFAGYDHERVVADATAAYGDSEGVKKAVLKFPQFAGRNHARVVREATAVYGDSDGVKKAVLKHPPFAGLDHARVIRERTRLGRIVGMGKQEVIEKILDNPVLGSYSAKRYLAALDIGRKLAKEGFKPDKSMLDAYFNYVSKSPYVPGTNRLRISQAGPDSKEPLLMNKMRRSLHRK